MKIAYILMQYPVPTQTFAISDVEWLIGQGHEVSIHCLLRRHRSFELLRNTYGLENQFVSHASIQDLILLPVRLLSRCSVVTSAFAKIVRTLIKKPRELVRAIYLFPALIRVLLELEAIAPEVVHAFWGHYPALIPYLWGPRNRSKVSSLFLGAYDLEQKLHISKIAAGEADCVFTHSHSNRIKLEELNIRPKRLVVSHRGIPFFDVETMTCQARSRRVCTVSALQREKRVDLVISVFAEMLERISDAELTIVGDGPERQSLLEQCKRLGIAHRVRFTLHVPRAEVLRIMSESKLLLFLSQKKSDRLPNVVKEAMYAGCRCLVSKTHGIEELVPPDLGCIVSYDESIDEMASLASNLLLEEDSSHARDSMKFITENFSMERSMRKYSDTWLGLLDAHEH